MVNWRCLTHFPDGSERVCLVPGPAPVPKSADDDRQIVIKLAGQEGLWVVEETNSRVFRLDYAAEIWVRPATDKETRHSGRKS